MTRTYVCSMVLIAAFSGCIAEDVDETTSVVSQHFINMQGTELQGMNLQGASLGGMAMQGFRFDTATFAGAPLSNLRVERGELVGETGSTTLRGTSLTGAHVFAAMRN